MKTKSILICLLFAVTANSFTAAKAQVNITDSLALVDLYNSTDGPHWKNHTKWLTANPVSTWHGITVTGGSNVVHIILINNNLIGVLPASIGNLTKLAVLKLGGNQLSDTIPSSIGNLLKLTELDLEYNQLSGAIPSTLGNLTKLTHLYLNVNQFTGAIPFSLHKLQSQVIDLEYNRLTKFADGYTSKNTDYISMFIDHNHFTFDGLQVIAKYYPNITYGPQQDTILPIHQNGRVLSVSAGGTLSNNTYTWFKVGDTSKTVIKKDSTFSPAQSGRYYARVSNAIVTQPDFLYRDLILTTDTITYIKASTVQNKIANTTAIKASSHLSIYPNPAKVVIHVQTNGTATIVLTNSAGKTLLTKTINNNSDINVSRYVNGVYYIQNKTTGETQKVVVVH